MPEDERNDGHSPQCLEKEAGQSSGWCPSDDKHLEEVTCFLEPESDDVEAAANICPTSKKSQLDGREPFDPILWSSRKKWTHVLVVTFITCVT